MVTRGGSCIIDDRRHVYEESIGECIRKIVAGLGEDETIVLDEFQRLPEEYWDILALKRTDLRGKLILCGSSLGVAGKVFDSNSPLLGLVAPFKIDLISPEDTIASLSRTLGPREAVLWAVIVRDPWILLFIEPGGDPWRKLVREAYRLSMTPSSLIGEVFEEEEKQLTRLYDTILRLLAHRYWSPRHLAQKLYEARLIVAPNPGVVTGVLSQLERMGLVDKIPLWRTRRNRYYYKHRSPLLSLLTRISEVVDAGYEPEPETILYDYSLELQFFLGELLAKYKKLNLAYTILPGDLGDIDIVLIDRRKRPRIAYEVKIGEYRGNEIKRVVERIRGLGIPYVGLISLSSKPTNKLVDEAYGPEDIVEIAHSLVKRMETTPPSP